MAYGAEGAAYGGGPGQATAGHGGPAAGRVELKERPYIQGLLLAVVTFGLYGLWWHYSTHDELCRQVGRENKERPLWIVHIVLYLLIAVLTILVIVMFFVAIFEAAERADFDDEAAMEAFIEALIGFGFGMLVLTVAWVAQVVIFVVYVAKQYNLIDDVRHRLGMHPKTGAGWFFGWYYGGGFLFSLVTGGLLSFIGPVIAYVNPQEHYNELYRYYAYGQHPGAYVAGAQGVGAGSHPTSGAGVGTAHGDATDPWASTQAAPAATPPGEEPWGRKADQNTFRIKGSGEATAPGAGRHLEQSFKCPRCHAHVTARGAPGSLVEIRCSQCGEAGNVRLPEA